ncbi:MAG: aldose epimerase family protein [Bacteroidia bacterium]|nr:aldose epimerase family protein [Bacteroidia bacterium]
MSSNSFLIAISLVLASLFIACNSENQSQTDPATTENGLSVTVQDWGQTPEGLAHLFIMKNKNGVEVRVTDYGATHTAFIAPDKNGNMGDITLGFDQAEGYGKPHPYFGSTVGRYGNRIANAQFSIDGQVYKLAANNGPNHLHGGVKGFGRVMWTGKEIIREDAVGVELSYTSADGEEGYPGKLEVITRYLLNNNDELRMEYEATTDKKTVCNLTNHAYFNLGGTSDILSHELMIAADSFTPVNETLIPTGELRAVEGTPFDFRTPMAIGSRINAEDEQIKFGGGYDHNYVLSRSGEGMEKIVEVYDPSSGRVLEVLTEEPGVQFYTGNFLDGTLTGKGGSVYAYRSGFCLETQHFPDSPNQPQFPSTLLNPGETYKTATTWRVSVRK